MEEFLADREQRMVQDLLHSWEIDLSVLSVGMVAVREQSGGGQQR
jgi:hypothetical protein